MPLPTVATLTKLRSSMPLRIWVALALSVLLSIDTSAKASAGLIVDAKTAGAIGDGSADDTAALQRALDGGQRTVVIPKGTYLIRKTLLLDSATTIKAAPDAIIRLADKAGTSVDVFLLSNRDSVKGNSHVIVDGGIWDGNNANNPRGDPATMPCYTGVGMHFNNVQGLVLRNLTIRNPETYAIRAIHLRDFRIEDIGFDFSVTRANQDGVHLNGFCEQGVIRNLTALSPFATNDDMVALNADDGDPKTYVFQQGMVNGPIRNITIENLRAPSVFSFVRLLSHEQPIENVTIDGIVGGARFYVINMDRWRFPPGGGRIQNVTIRHLQVHKMADNFSSQARAAQRPLVHIQSAVKNFRIEDFVRDEREQPPAVTLLIDNKLPNRVKLAGLTPAQAEALRIVSPGITPAMVSQTPTTDNSRVAPTHTLSMESNAQLTLPNGGFTLLTLDTIPPASGGR
ncbi:MAG TPA: glycosyl hydrolase family 28-related protein [Opitutaceae bacterium]|nr:glycosyl hydrolase family 28-related protein [Opitutaceae bacterium]